MPKVYDMEFAELKYPVRWDNSMNTVLVQELMRFNNLNSVIQRSLQDMMDAIKGIVVMSADLELFGHSVYYGVIPSKWDAASYPSLKPLASYIADLLKRLDFLQAWLDGEAPPIFWLSAFHFTQAFLTGTGQNYARKYTIPIDSVTWDFAMIPGTVADFKSPPEDGVYVHGLFIDGARWSPDDKILTDSLPKILFSEAPAMHLLPKEQSALKPWPCYECPTYKTSARFGMLSTTGHSTNFVMFIKIPSDRRNDVWTEAGVALSSTTDSKN